jgi:beta-lactamase regulating signal transducer with metallopeptidase domain
MIRAVIASTIVLGLAGLAATLAHRASASVRHAIWFVGLVTALGVGALAAAGPLIEIESSFVKSPGVVDFPADFRESFRGTAAPMQPIANQAPRAIARSSAARIRTDSLLIALWAMGVAFIIGRALFSHVAVARLVSRSRHLDADLRLDVYASIDVRLSHDVDGPFTLGALRPVILLPLDAEYWTSERLRIVLVHEAAHVARLDYIAQLVATVACAIYWFNPIAWLAAFRLRAEAEHAADDRVLAAGVDGVTYASHLLELAQPGRAPLSTPIAVRMAQGTTRLEKRFTAMLDSQRSRGIVPLRLQAAVGSAAMLVAVPFTSMRLIPVEPKAPPIALSEPAPLAVVAPAVVTTGKPVVPKPRQAKPTQSTRSFQQADTIVSVTSGTGPVIRDGGSGVPSMTLAASSVWATAYQERDEINRSFTVPAKARVEVVAINGSVDIKAIDGDTASVEIERTARSRAELDCNKVVSRQVSGNLFIKSEAVCENRVIQVRHRVLLSLPRNVDLTVIGVSGPVNVGEIEGPISISGISGNVNLAQAGRRSRISGNMGTTTIKLRKLSAGGLELSGNSGPIKLYIGDELNAVVRVSGISGSVSSDLPAVTFHKTAAADYYAPIGSRGPTIYVLGHVGNLLLSQYRE